MTSSDNSATPEQPGQPGQPSQPSQPEQPEQAEQPEIVLGKDTLRMRRAPKYYNFMILGGVIGVVSAVALTVAFPDGSEYGTAQVFGFLMLACVVIGIALGSLVALLLERIIGRSAKTVVADRLGAQVSSTPESTDAAADSPSSASQPEL